MKKFLSEIADETVDLKSLGIRGTDKQKIIDVIRAAMVLQSMPEELRRVAVEQVRILNSLTFN